MGQTGQSPSSTQTTTATPTQSTTYEPVSIGRTATSSGDGSGATAGVNQPANGPLLDANAMLELESLSLRQPLKSGEFETWAQQVSG